MESPRYSRRVRGTMLLVAALAAVAIVAATLGIRSYFFPGISVGDIIENHPSIGDARDVTGEYCANEIDCQEAWETQYGVYMQFDSRAEATHWATIFGGEGAQWKNLVLDARDRDLSSDERVTAVQILLVYDGV